MRKLVTALAIGLLSVTGALGVSVHPAAASVSSGVKVVLVVGATGSTTASYRADADAAAAVAAKYTNNIVKVYSPNATWSAVQSAAAGASILIYLGHGSGYPNPYVGYLQPNGDNGMGLNASAGGGDSNTKYYGENYMAQLNLAPNAVVLLNHLCYASGDNEWGRGLPTLAAAKTRVDGYASGFLRGNAQAVIAEGLGDLGPYIDALFATRQTVDQIWKSYPNFHNNVTTWPSSRNVGFTSEIDPDYQNPAGDGDYYYRSIVFQSGQGISGPDVFAMAAAVAASTWPSPCHCTAYIAYAYNFPDALAGAAAAGTVHGPVLFVATTGAIDASTAAELTRLAPDHIVVLGGTGVISDAVFAALSAYAPAGQTVRYFGADRFATAASVSANTFAANCGCTVYIAYAMNFPDALAGAAAAGTVPGPVLLVATTGAVNASTVAELTRLKPAHIVVLGGTGVVSAAVYNSLAPYAPAGHIARYYGVDRYGTAASISSHTFAANCGCVVYISSGTDFNGALAAAAAAGTIKGPLLLAGAAGDEPPATAAELSRLNPIRIVVIGG